MKYLSISVILCLFLFTINFDGLNSQVNYPWMYYLPYGETVVLKPLYRNQSENVIVKTCKWTTPKQVDLLPDTYNFDQFRYKIDKVKCELTIYDIQKDTNGVYHCTVNDLYISKAMLNVHGAPKKTILEEWKPNLIAGFATFGGVIAFFLFTCGVYKFRYQEPIKYMESNHKKDRVDNHYKNQAFDEQEIDDVSDKTSEDLQNIRF